MVGCWEDSKERIYVMERESEIKRIRFRGKRDHWQGLFRLGHRFLFEKFIIIKIMLIMFDHII